MKIYTKQGDTGKTSLLSERVSKTNNRIDAMGTIDELMVKVGFLIMTFTKEKRDDLIFDTQRIYRNLFIIQSAIADSENKFGYAIDPGDVEKLETDIDMMSKDLPQLKHFICYTGVDSAMLCHEIRAKTRTVERKVVGIFENDHVDAVVLRYINRLSDYFYTLARYMNFKNGYEEDTIQI